MGYLVVPLATCFLFFCPPHHSARTPQCDALLKGYTADIPRDTFVAQFPVKRQHRVLECIAKQEGQQS